MESTKGAGPSKRGEREQAKEALINDFYAAMEVAMQEIANENNGNADKAMGPDYDEGNDDGAARMSLLRKAFMVAAKRFYMDMLE